MWPNWWPGLLHVKEIKKSEGNNKNILRRYTWQSKLPYTVITDIKNTAMRQYAERIEGVISGELEGSGIWKISQNGNICTVQYLMTVAPTKWWMKITAPIARPLYKWNHHIIMRWGAEGLAAYLDVELVCFKEMI